MDHFSISVHELIEFCCRSGDLTRSRRKTPSALEGIQAHQKVQASRGPGYRKEVTVEDVLITPTLTLCIKGRMDGIDKSSHLPILEEIKSTYLFQAELSEEQRNFHFAQLKIYSYIYCQQNEINDCSMHLTYFNLKTAKTYTFKQKIDLAELQIFYHSATNYYLGWLEKVLTSNQQRNQSIDALEFPFVNYRAGQRELAVNTYKCISTQQQFIAQAPTGIGKTISTLFPAIKAMAENKTQRIIYCTAKNSGKQMAADTLRQLRTKNLQAKTLFITAREKICFFACADKNESSSDSNVPITNLPITKQCSYKIGYYDKLAAARQEIFNHDILDQQKIEEICEHYQLCPFEFMLDIAPWMDIIICDYNYIFDPRVNLQNLFDRQPRNTTLLVDECHNLVDRSLSMYSTNLCRSEVKALAKTMQPYSLAIAKSLKRINKQFLELSQSSYTVLKQPTVENPQAAQEARRLKEIPEKFLFALLDFCHDVERFFEEDSQPHVEDELKDLLFKVHHFLRISEFLADNYAIILFSESKRDRHISQKVSQQSTLQKSTLQKSLFQENSSTIASKAFSHRESDTMSNVSEISLLCLNAAPQLNSTLSNIDSAIFFSATLKPSHYFKEVLGLKENCVVSSLPYPFNTRNLKVVIGNHINTTYSFRDSSIEDVIDMIDTTTSIKKGKYLVYLPSYKYLETLRHKLADNVLIQRSLFQHPRMTEAEKSAFIGRFKSDDSELIGFAVISGVFGEGIDLPGDQLIGVIIVGVGLPQLSLERNLMKAYYEEVFNTGFEFAYQFPGFSRVMQAAGRTIRTADDKGVIVLLDQRFSQSRYKTLFPEHWDAEYIVNQETLKLTLNLFWQTEEQVS